MASLDSRRSRGSFVNTGKMTCFWAGVSLLFLTFIGISETRISPPYNITFCNKSIEFPQTDCSFMLGAPPGSCVIHHTNSCKVYGYESWNLAPEHEAKSLVELDYSISLSTYENSNELTLNVSINTLSKDVRGFTFTLLEYKFPNKLTWYNTCRLFDYREFSAYQPVSLYYDCYYKIQGDSDNKFFLLTARGLPTNNVGVFHVTLSTSSHKQGGETLCNWESTVMILEPALSNGNVIALFSTADASLNISKYDVALFKHGPSGHDLINQRTVVGDMQEGVMNVVEFPRTDRGTYHLEIHPIHPDWKDSCTITMTDTFVIFSVTHFEVILVASLIGAILVIIILAGAAFYVYVKRRKPESTRQSSVFLLYSYDSDDHYAKVCALYKFLTDVPGLEVAFDAAEANEMGVPHLWLTNQLHNVDHVVLVVSEGVYDKVEKGKRPPHEHHPWGDQVYTAVLEIIRDERLHNKLIKVILNGTSDIKVPTCLFSKGKAFKLPKQLDRFVHYIFNEKCRSSLECMAKHSDWLNPVRERTLVRVLKRQGSTEPS
ncbi:uncharacterized protein ISCGN_028478 [Ixodes scapularis]